MILWAELCLVLQHIIIRVCQKCSLKDPRSYCFSVQYSLLYALIASRLTWPHYLPRFHFCKLDIIQVLRNKDNLGKPLQRNSFLMKILEKLLYLMFASKALVIVCVYCREMHEIQFLQIKLPRPVTITFNLWYIQAGIYCDIRCYWTPHRIYTDKR